MPQLLIKRERRERLTYSKNDQVLLDLRDTGLSALVLSKTPRFTGGAGALGMQRDPPSFGR